MLFQKQLSQSDCGAACLRMIASFYNKNVDYYSLQKILKISRVGTSMHSISKAAEEIGFKTKGLQVSIDDLKYLPTPSILHWNQKHFVVLLSIGKKKVRVADPAKAIITYSIEEFEKYWIQSQVEDKIKVGIVLLLEPTNTFTESTNLTEKSRGSIKFKDFVGYYKRNKWRFFQLLLSFVVLFAIQTIFPYLSQSLIDIGINLGDKKTVIILLITQLIITTFSSFISMISSRIGLKLSNFLNLSILSDFWIKIISLPINYFGNKKTGDILQKLGDNHTVQTFISNIILTSSLSILRFIIYSTILLFYSPTLFLLVIAGDLLYFGWISIFFPIKRKLNFLTFDASSDEHSMTIEMIQGMRDLKLNNSANSKRWEWEDIQIRLFSLRFKTLDYNQIQSIGVLLINSIQNIVITFLIASYVIDGSFSLGQMIAVQFIISQISGPLHEIIGVIQDYENTKVSLQRLNSIYEIESEENENCKIDYVNTKDGISIRNLNFSYLHSNGDIFENITFDIPYGKLTAFVGTSGSGKTTMMKILTKLETDYRGEVLVGSTELQYISPSFWRSRIGVVLQDGYFFNDSILKNICFDDTTADMIKVEKCCEIANIIDHIKTLPNGFNTLIGADGLGLSQGQKQRILIARAIYRDPDFLFLDEATNSLDSMNEKEIVNNLNQAFENKTLIVIAHRLSTIKNAHKIVVFDNGVIVEIGNHEELMLKSGIYYKLIQNQLFN